MLFNSMTTIADYLIQLPNTTASDLQSVLTEWNPFGDVTIDEFNQLRALIVKEYRIRTGNYKRTYWQRLSFAERVIAEAEAQYLLDLFRVVTEAERCYLVDTHLEREAAIFDKWLDSDTIGKDVAKTKAFEQRAANLIHKADLQGNVQILQDAEVAEGMASCGALLGLVPGYSPIHSTHLQWLNRPSFEKEPEILATPVRTGKQEELALWRDSLSDMQSQFHSHWLRLMMDVVSNRHMNLIGGKNAENRLVLSNHGIPVPMANSFLGWFGHCGIAFRRMFREEQDYAARVCGFMPESIMTYMLPAMPMTKEHVSGSLLQTPDSTSDHSLHSRNKAHARDSNGRLLFGQWRVRTVLLGTQPGVVYTVADEALSTLDRRPMAIHEQHLSMLPYYRSTISGWTTGGKRNLDVFFPGRTDEDVRLTTGFMVDPSVRGSSIPVYWSLFTRGLALPWSSLAQQSKLHFRFDWSPDGKESADLWCSHFETAAWQYAHATHGERKHWQFGNLIDHVRYIRGVEDQVVSHGKAGDTKFDLSFLK